MNIFQSSGFIATALASVLACYGVSMRATGERATVVAARQQIAADIAEMQLLRTELRTRSRLPELQRWNEQVLSLAAPRAEQHVADTVMLASYATPSTPNLPGTSAAVVTAVVRNAATPAAVVGRASYVTRQTHDLGTDAALAEPSRLVQVSYRKVSLR